MNSSKQRIVIKKKKKKQGFSLINFFLGIVCTVGFGGLYLSFSISNINTTGTQGKADGTVSTAASSSSKTLLRSKSSAESKGADVNTSSTESKKADEEKTPQRFVKINHAVEGAKLKKSNEPGHLQFDILQASYESKSHYITDNLWQDILNKGVEIMEKNNYAKHLVVIEVGAHIAKQSIDAAKLKYHAYCVEPSPKSFKMMYTAAGFRLRKEPQLAPYLHLLNMAAGSETGNMLEFKSAGSTGDHIGNFDMWNMKVGNADPDLPASKKGDIVKVSSLKIDDLIYNRGNYISKFDGLSSDPPPPPPIDDVFAIKIDTQGYEPEVFSGLTESIKNNKIKYVLFEYWPNGMALLNNRTDKCEFATQILTNLVSAGYTLHALPVLFHPSIRLREVHYGVTRWFERPFDDYKADCEYLLNLEQKFPLEDYKAGFWTDYLAVAPGSDPIEAKAFGYV